MNERDEPRPARDASRREERDPSRQDKSRQQGSRQSRRRYSDEFLRRLRNEIPIRSVIEALSIPHKYRDGYFRFVCPLCEFTHTGLNPEANLARCFRCQRNFNPIEMVMAADSADFVLAVSYLAPMLRPGGQG